MEYQTAVGDILLVTGTAKHSSALATLQKALYNQARSSHVAFSLGGGAFIHSTTDKGVHLAFFPDIIKDCTDDWRIIRLRSLTKEQERLLLGSSNYHLAQKYNYAYMMPGNKTSSFCSEFASKSYCKANIGILNGLESSKTAPAHFDKEADDLIEWMDVSADYRTLLEEINSDPKLAYAGFAYLAHRLERIRAVNARTEFLFALASQIFKTDESREGLKKAKQELESQRLFSYWDIHKQD
ncbi:hypothetical protein GCM10023213_10940 [Prosthecobacter algae]|uniref:Permuted papain-like amidase YaeF/Yiix C92 family enzyme n=1 Tax=Prosthecobacter algae TaxID=1144682 RepID=A0ABP9NYL4_9BACT